MSEAIQQRLLESCSLSKAEGAFIALAAGDALGWPQEISRNRIDPSRQKQPQTSGSGFAEMGDASIHMSGSLEPESIVTILS